MGKGDKKSRRGKITIGSYGVRRARKKKSPAPVIIAKIEDKKKAPAKKAAKVVAEAPAVAEGIPAEVAVKAPKKKAAPKKAAKKETENE